MKKFGLLVFAAILGSAITIATVEVFDLNSKNTMKIEHINSVPVKSALYTANESGDIVPLDFTKIADKMMEGVVNIKSTQTIRSNRSANSQQVPDQFRDLFGDDDLFERFFGPRFYFENPKSGPQVRVGTGSGVIISSDGYIVTNNHVVSDADDIEVTLHDNRTYKAKVIGTDPSTDLALIQIKEKDLVHLPLTNSDDVKIGEWVLAIGNPFNLNSTVTAGIVSAKARNINILQDRGAIESFIQTDAAINPGNSGGALVNLQGGLIGINTAIASPTGAYAGYGFAIPSNIVKKVVNDIIEYGSVQRGYLGIMIRDVDGNLAREKDLKVTSGVYVDSLTDNSAAKAAGIQAGDVVLKVDEIGVKHAPELQELIARRRPGDKVNITVNRKGKEKSYTVTLNNKEGKTQLISKTNDNVLDILGIEVKDLDENIARKLDIEGGVLISKVKSGKIQRETDIKEGFIITKADNKPVKNKEDLIKILDNKSGGILLEGIYEDYPGNYYYAFGM